MNSLHKQIKGEDKNVINFNNIDWCLKLRLDITRKKTIEIINNSLKPSRVETNKKHNDIVKNDLIY